MRNVKIFFGALVVGILLMAEGAGFAIAAMRNGVSFELPTGVVFEVETEGHQFELVGE